MVIDTVAFEDLEPWGGGDILAAIFVPVDLRGPAQDAGFDEWADVEADAIVRVRLPADGLLLQWLPADEDVVGGLTFENLFEGGFQFLCGGELGVAAFLAGGCGPVL